MKFYFGIVISIGCLLTLRAIAERKVVVSKVVVS